MKIGSKFALTVALSTSLTVATFAGANYYIDKQNQKSITQIQKESTDDLSKELTHSIEKITEEQLKLNSNMAIKEVQSTLNLPESTLLLYANHESLVSDDEKNIQKTLDTAMTGIKENSAYIYIGTKNKDYYLSPYEEMPDDYDPTSRPWYNKDLKKGDLFYSEIYEDVMINTLMVTISTPVFDKDNKFYGVLAADVTLPTVQKVMSQYKIGETGYIIIVDPKSGYIVSHPDKEVIDKFTKVSDLDIFNKNGEIKDKSLVSYKQIEPVTGWEVYVVQDKKEAYTSISSATDTVTKSTEKLTAEMNNQNSNSLYNTILNLIGAIIVALIASAILSRIFSKPIRELSDVAEHVGNGDLSKKVNLNRDDELGVLANVFNGMIDNLRDTADNLNSTSQKMQNGANVLDKQVSLSSTYLNDINSSMNTVSHNASKQSDSIMETSSIMEEMSASLQQVNSNIKAIANNVSDTDKLASQGQSTMRTATNSMKNIEKQSTESSELISAFDKKLSEISKITDLIKEITEQTNLLALNASIEAARAGEHGRGFAIVAQEVKKLAGQSESSIKQINNLISEIQNESSKIVKNINTGQKSIKDGTSLMVDAESIFVDIASKIEYLRKDINNIVTTADEMSRGSQQVAVSMENLSASSQEIVSSMEETTSNVSQQSTEMKKIHNISSELKEIANSLEKFSDKFTL